MPQQQRYCEEYWLIHCWNIVPTKRCWIIKGLFLRGHVHCGLVWLHLHVLTALSKGDQKQTHLEKKTTRRGKRSTTWTHLLRGSYQDFYNSSQKEYNDTNGVQFLARSLMITASGNPSKTDMRKTKGTCKEGALIQMAICSFFLLFWCWTAYVAFQNSQPSQMKSNKFSDP